MRKVLILGLMVLPLLAAGCSKGPAEAALKAADEAIAKVAPDAEKYVPEQFKTLTDAAAAAKASFDKGEYAAALEAAKNLPAKATEVMTAATAKKEEMLGQWNILSKDMPILVADWQKKFDELVASKKLPKTATPERIEELKGKLAEVSATWAKATDAFNAGDIKGALENGASVKASVDWMQSAWDALQPAKK
jgi:ribonuclease HI